MNNVNESNSNRSTSLDSSKLRVQDSDVQEIIKLIKGDLNECEKLEENKFNSQSLEKLESSQFDELRLSTQQPATSSSSKLVNQKENENPINSNNDENLINEENKSYTILNNFNSKETEKSNEIFSDTFNEDYDGRLSSKLTKTSLSTHYQGYCYDLENHLDRLKLVSNLNKTNQDDYEEDDIENDFNSAQSLERKTHFKNNGTNNNNNNNNTNERDIKNNVYSINDQFDENTSSSIKEFINKAIDFGANALDLCKRDIIKIPIELLCLQDLQVLEHFQFTCSSYSFRL